jgi:uncharacterized protein YjbI with pentapeptide repeats
MAKLTREEVEQIVKKGPGGRSELPRLNKRDLSHLDLSKVDFNWANLGGANIRETNLSGAKLTSANLGGPKLFGTNLSGADLTMANLLGAILIGANLSGAELYKADLSLSALAGVNFSKANLSWTDLTGSLLTEADLSKARLWGTIFGDIDLREVRGLDTVKHFGPSSIDTRTLIHSKGEIPEVFLRGCGLSDLQIEMAKLCHPDLTSNEVSKITNKIQDFSPSNTTPVSLATPATMKPSPNASTLICSRKGFAAGLPQRI